MSLWVAIDLRMKQEACQAGLSAHLVDARMPTSSERAYVTRSADASVASVTSSQLLPIFYLFLPILPYPKCFDYMRVFLVT
jgi:hypothetical protein